MTLAVDNFKAKLVAGGARPNLFKCIIPAPPVGAGAGLEENSAFMCKAAQLPGSVIGQIDVPYQGRQVRVAGDRTFENWTVTVINQAAFNVRAAFEDWLNKINAHESGEGEPEPAQYQADIRVAQLNRKNETLREYVLTGAFPINVAGIELAWESNDQVEEFTVEFAYQYWTATGAGGSIS